MLKDKEKKALESLKQIYLKNREEKTKEAKNRFFGFFFNSNNRVPKNKIKICYIDKRGKASFKKRSIVKDKLKFKKYKILKNY